MSTNYKCSWQSNYTKKGAFKTYTYSQCVFVDTHPEFGVFYALIVHELCIIYDSCGKRTEQTSVLVKDQLNESFYFINREKTNVLYVSNHPF